MNAPILTDDRVEAMRRNVMSGVSADVRRRARRSRWGAGVAAAALVVGIGGPALIAGTTTGSSDDSAGLSADSGADTARPVAPEDARSTERQVVRTGSATVVVDDPRAEAEAIVARVEKLGGRVDQRSEYGSGRDTSASLTLRVPSDRLTRVVAQLSLSGEVQEVVLDNDDVTSTVVDLDARIRALRISTDRLEKILADADSSAEVVAAENALTERQSQLEELTSQRTALAGDVEMATLDVSLTQDEKAADVDPSGFRGGLTRGWNALVDTVNGAVEVAGTVLPWAALLLLGYGALRVVRRVRR